MYVGSIKQYFYFFILFRRVINLGEKIKTRNTHKSLGRQCRVFNESGAGR